MIQWATKDICMVPKQNVHIYCIQCTGRILLVHGAACSHHGSLGGFPQQQHTFLVLSSHQIIHWEDDPSTCHPRHQQCAQYYRQKCSQHRQGIHHHSNVALRVASECKQPYPQLHHCIASIFNPKHIAGVFLYTPVYYKYCFFHSLTQFAYISPTNS